MHDLKFLRWTVDEREQGDADDGAWATVHVDSLGQGWGGSDANRCAAVMTMANCANDRRQGVKRRRKGPSDRADRGRQEAICASYLHNARRSGILMHM